MHGVGHIGYATDHPARGLKPCLPTGPEPSIVLGRQLRFPAAFLSQGLIKSFQFLAALITVIGFWEILRPAVRTLLRRSLGLNRLSAPWAKLGCGRKVLVALRTLVKDE